MTQDSQPVLEVRGVTKSFGAVDVLRGIDFAVQPGSVTALVGDNGAGKSTLIKGLAGIQPFDGGSIYFEGAEVELEDPKHASDLGIEVVYQDLALCDNLDIVQNMFLGR
ncbi:MAG: ATP-binding cassette domain-containing protein, partial [Candidatus Nanopelagicales bacterium]|nr:ATP-binding cassette domain-containing protein [Candidatus Nanopelagicales bacterium]